MKDYLEESGYKKEGKIYTPPILQLGEFNSVDWSDEILPELLWIGILQEKFNFGDGSNLASSIVKAALDVSEDKKIWFAPVSSFSNFSNDEKERIKAELSNNGTLGLIQNGFRALNQFYPKFPLNFLLNAEIIEDESYELEKLKKHLETLFDRTSIPANLIQGVALGMIFRSEIDFKINEGMALAQFPKFEEYPNSEISKQVASSIRATINAFFSNKDKFTKIDKDWSKYFWNRGLQIDNCY